MSRRRRDLPSAWACALAAAAVASCALPAVAAAKAGDLALVSRASGAGGAAGTGPSEGPAVTPDGRYVAFESLGGNLDPSANNGVKHVYVRDTVAQTTTLVSRASGLFGPTGDDWSSQPSISADGRYVAFASLADNLSGEDDDEASDVFVRDLLTGTTTLASRASGVAGAQSHGHSRFPSLSADGRRVAFQTGGRQVATGPNPGDYVSAGEWGVFVRDLATATTVTLDPAPTDPELPARTTFGTYVGDDTTPVLSADGRHVAFVVLWYFEDVTDPSDPDDEGAQSIEQYGVFETDLVTGRTIIVNRPTASRPGVLSAAGDARAPSVSADGRYVAFESDSDQLSFADDVAGDVDVYVHDALRNATTLVSRADGMRGAAAGGDAIAPSISDDGRFVAFASHADNLSPDDDDAPWNVFVRDWFAGTTTLVSRAAGEHGEPAHGASTRAAISATGRFAAFQSDADGLAEGAGDHSADVFERDLGEAPPASQPDPEAGPAPGPASSGSAPVDTTRPQITRLSASPRAFRAARSERSTRDGTRFRFTLSEPARVEALIERRRPGLRLGSGNDATCDRASRSVRDALERDLRRKGLRGSDLRRAIAERACVSFDYATQAFWPAAGRGRVALRFTGRAGRRALARGRYRATLTASDLAGNASRPRRIAFKITAPR